MKQFGIKRGGARQLAVAAGLWLATLAAPASAQFFDGSPVLRPPQIVPSAPAAPTPLSPGMSLAPPGVDAAPAPRGPMLQSLPPAANPGPGQSQTAPAVPAGQVALAVSARFGRDMPAIPGGLHWRVYASKPDQSGVFRLLKDEKGGAPVFALPPGQYIVHVGFGLANATKPVQLRAESVREVFELPAGGLRIEGRVGDVRIPQGQISFDIYQGSQFEPGNKRPLAQSVMTGDVLLLPEGTYHIASNYGDANSVVRSDIRVQTAKLTDATVTHRAAVIMLKLVNEPGGEALANTQWSVLTPGGDVIKESIGAFPRVILAEGEYRAIARNEDKTYERPFRVITGVDGQVEVLAR